MCSFGPYHNAFISLLRNLSSRSSTSKFCWFVFLWTVLISPSAATRPLETYASAQKWINMFFFKKFERKARRKRELCWLVFLLWTTTSWSQERDFSHFSTYSWNNSLRLEPHQDLKWKNNKIEKKPAYHLPYLAKEWFSSVIFKCFEVFQKKSFKRRATNSKRSLKEKPQTTKRNVNWLVFFNLEKDLSGVRIFWEVWKTSFSLNADAKNKENTKGD